MKIVYLDFDGVLHPEAVYWKPSLGAYLAENWVAAGHRLFEHANLLEELLSPYPDVRIVLSTSWVVQYRFSGAAKRLPASLRERCIGATFHTQVMDRYLFQSMTRGAQVSADVRRRRPDAWLAIDDTDEGWDDSSRGNLVLSHGDDGIAHPDVLPKLRRRLAEQFQCTLTTIPSGKST